MKRHIARLRSICETLGEDFDTSAHCTCGKLCVDTTIHLTTEEVERMCIEKHNKANDGQINT